jgi:hypothetical protein
MTTSEERMRILQMIQEGKISAEEGAKLLEARGQRQRPPVPPVPPHRRDVMRACCGCGSPI